MKPNGNDLVVLVFAAIDLLWLGLCLLRIAIAKNKGIEYEWRWSTFTAVVLILGTQLWGASMFFLYAPASASTVLTVCGAMMWTIMVLQQYYSDKHTLWIDRSWAYVYVLGLIGIGILHLVVGPLLDR